MAKHHPISASKIERLLKCSGSFELVKHAPPDRPNKESSEGTWLHALTEEQLRGYLSTGKVIEQSLGSKYTQSGFEFEFEAKHRDAVRESVAYVIGVLTESGAPRSAVTLEERVSIPTSWELAYPEDGPCSGILDCSILIAMSCLYIIDYKYGKGVKVHPEDNMQLIYYGLGKWLQLDDDQRDIIDRVKFVIIQPLHYTGASIEVWTTDPHEVFGDFRSKLDAGVARILANDFTLTPGTWCRWCPAKSICEAYQNQEVSVPQYAETLNQLTVPIAKSLPAPSQLSNSQLGELLAKKKILDSFMEVAKAEAIARLEDGQEVPHCRLKPKRANRVFSSDLKALSNMVERLYSEGLANNDIFDLRTPKQIEDVCKVYNKKIDLSEYIIKPDNGMTLAVDGE